MLGAGVGGRAEEVHVLGCVHPWWIRNKYGKTNDSIIKKVNKVKIKVKNKALINYSIRTGKNNTCDEKLVSNCIYKTIKVTK